MLCETCSGEHDGSFASGRFCSRICARKFPRTPEILKRMSEIAIIRKRSDNLAGFKNRLLELRRQKLKIVVEQALHSDWNQLSIFYKKHVVLIQQLGRCACCGIYEWVGKPISLEWHHKDGNHDNNSRENVEFDCPNCHSQTDTFRGRNVKLRGNKTGPKPREVVSEMVQ